jgi:hypothetical protein
VHHAGCDAPGSPDACETVAEEKRDSRASLSPSPSASKVKRSTTDGRGGDTHRQVSREPNEELAESSREFKMNTTYQDRHPVHQTVTPRVNTSQRITGVCVCVCVCARMHACTFTRKHPQTETHAYTQTERQTENTHTGNTPPDEDTSTILGWGAETEEEERDGEEETEASGDEREGCVTGERGELRPQTCHRERPVFLRCSNSYGR